MVGLTEPLPPPVLTKRDMYVRIERGEFGNTLPRWYDWEQWTADPLGRDRYELWGVQSRTVANDPRARLNVHRADVFPYLESSGLLRDGYVLSTMVGQVGQTLWEGNVARRDVMFRPGLVAEGHLNPSPGSWRRHMLAPQLWEGSAATVLLREVMNDNSYDDLMDLLSLYPDHAIEFSALDVQFGTHPGRNCVVWEVRRY